MSEKEQIKNLVKLIKYHNKKYWIDNDPEISDSDYDKLEINLKKLDPNNKVFDEIYDIKIKFKTKRKKVKHIPPMLSLNKVYSTKDLFSWCLSVSRNENELFSLQPKLDGISGDIDKGILSTRGDGEIGEDISSKKIIMNYIGPNNTSTIMELFNGKDRGEIIIKKQVFENIKNKIKRSDGSYYKTPRGLCSGLLMRDNTDISFGRILNFVSFNTYSQNYSLKQLQKLDFKQLEKELSSWIYNTDGLVIKLVDEEYSKSLGYTSHHPKGQIAFKFDNPSKETILEGIEWSMGKHTITPVGLIRPVEINNAKISRVSLHNGKFILDKNLHIGDYVTVERAGEIIPYVLSSRPGKERKKITLEKCPQCGKEVTYEEPEIICTNRNCAGSAVHKLYDSVVRIGIENIGLSTVKKLYNIGIENVIDVLNLSKVEISSLPGFANKSIDNLYNEIQKIKSKKIEDWRILSCLNLKGIGTSLSKKLLKQFTLYELLSMTEEDLINLDDIGPERAKEIEEGLFENEILIEELVTMFPDLIESKGKKIKGKVCFTGKGPKPRNFFKKMAEEEGYTSTNSVSKDLTFLVTDEIHDG